MIGVAGVAAGDDFLNTTTGNVDRVSRNTIIGNRVRLNFDTSFTGRDLLRTRLQAQNLSQLPTNQAGEVLTNEGALRFAGEGNNQVGIDALLYQFPLGEKTTVTIEANAGAIDDFTNTINPFLDGDGATGALSQFGTRNSIYYLLGGKGIGIRHEFGDALELTLGYLANDDSASSPASGNGLFNGPYGAIAQLTVKPSERFAIGLTYINAYNNDFSTAGPAGSNRANFQTIGEPTSTNAYGVGATFQISPQFVVNGSVGYTNARSLGDGTKGTLDIWNWSVGLAFPDLGKKGNLAGIIVGQEPKVARATGNFGQLIGGRDRDTSLHIEGFYQYQLTDNISITPGIIWLTAPDHNNQNDDIVIGTIRTTFTF